MRTIKTLTCRKSTKDATSFIEGKTYDLVIFDMGGGYGEHTAVIDEEGALCLVDFDDMADIAWLRDKFGEEAHDGEIV